MTREKCCFKKKSNKIFSANLRNKFLPDKLSKQGKSISEKVHNLSQEVGRSKDQVRKNVGGKFPAIENRSSKGEIVQSSKKINDIALV